MRCRTCVSMPLEKIATSHWSQEEVDGGLVLDPLYTSSQHALLKALYFLRNIRAKALISWLYRIVSIFECDHLVSL